MATTTPVASNKSLTTKSVIVKDYGGYNCLTVEQYPLPDHLEQLVQVKVKMAGLNFADLYARQGLMRDRSPPFVLGIECVGTVTAIGTEVATNNSRNLKVGDRVIGYNHQGGMFREVVCLPPHQLYPVPDWVHDEEAAAIFVNYLTAYFAVVRMGALQPRNRILITSCGGGVGWAATQIARTIPDVTVYGTASAHKIGVVRENGVEEVIQREDLFKDMSRKFDVIVTDEVGPQFTQMQQLLQPLGHIVVLGAKNLVENERKLSVFKIWRNMWNTKPVRIYDLMYTNSGVAGLHLGLIADTQHDTIAYTLAKLFDMLRDGLIKPRIHETFRMENVIDATKVLALRQNIGKVLLTMGTGERIADP